MQFSSSTLLDKYPFYYSTFAFRGRKSKKEVDDAFFAMRKWCTERMKVNSDYKWAQHKFNFNHKYGTSRYPVGIHFKHESDALAFQLTFL